MYAYIDMCTEKSAGMCVDIGTDMGMDRCTYMGIAMCFDMRIYNSGQCIELQLLKQS